MAVTKTVKEWIETVETLSTDAELVSADGEEPDEAEENRLHGVIDQIEAAIDSQPIDSDEDVTIDDLEEADLR